MGGEKRIGEFRMIDSKIAFLGNAGDNGPIDI